MKFIMKSAGINLKGSDAEKLINVSELCRQFNLNVNTFNTMRFRYGWSIEQTLCVLLADSKEE
ncbi:hypothetical protein ABK730_08195 [Klebsiella indica]|uniref:hypothetical protein n=1 Tax=Klebsiella TaxID=570 RepID=UPI0031B6F139